MINGGSSDKEMSNFNLAFKFFSFFSINCFVLPEKNKYGLPLLSFKISISLKNNPSPLLGLKAFQVASLAENLYPK